MGYRSHESPAVESELRQLFSDDPQVQIVVFFSDQEDDFLILEASFRAYRDTT